jgi:hypothetical protein
MNRGSWLIHASTLRVIIDHMNNRSFILTCTCTRLHYSNWSIRALWNRISWVKSRMMLVMIIKISCIIWYSWYSIWRSYSHMILEISNKYIIMLLIVNISTLKWIFLFYIWRWYLFLSFNILTSIVWTYFIIHCVSLICISLVSRESILFILIWMFIRKRAIKILYIYTM